MKELFTRSTISRFPATEVVVHRPVCRVRARRRRAGAPAAADLSIERQDRRWRRRPWRPTWYRRLGREERLRALSQELTSPVVLERVAREERLTSARPIEKSSRTWSGTSGVDLPTPIARTGATGAERVRHRLSRPHRRTSPRILPTGWRRSSSRSTRAAARSARRRSTAEFLGGQLRAAQERIPNLESRLRTAKERHMGNLPEQTVANLRDALAASVPSSSRPARIYAPNRIGCR